MGKGGGGPSGGSSQPTQTTSTSNVTNIPEYARPYVETMLGATQKQLFNMDDSGNITGFKPYKAYGGTYDEQGNELSYDPSKAVAGFSPLQTQAQEGISKLSLPGQFGGATALTGMAGMNAMGAGQNLQNTLTDSTAMGQYMNPYLQNALQPQLQEMQRQYDITGMQQQGKATAAGAFGGSRGAIMDAENQRNKNMGMNQAIGQGYNQAYQNAQQQANNVANMGLQGYQMAGQAGASLANIGSSQLAAQQGIYGAQNQAGAQQQAQQQQIINQAMQDYANKQQNPLMQLGFMSNMTRGLPMQATTTNQYVAQPNAITQGIGLAGAGASIYNALKAKGGQIKEKKMAAGGIASYSAGDEVKSDLYKMPTDALQRQFQIAESESEKRDIKMILAQRKMSETIHAAKGGIMSFATGTEDAIKEDPAAVRKAYREAALLNSTTQQPKPYSPPPTSVAAPAPSVEAPIERADQAAVRQAQIDAALLQGGNQNMPKNLQYVEGVTDRAQFMNPDSAAAKAMTRKNLAGTGLSMEEDVAKQKLQQDLAASGAKRKDGGIKTFAELPADQQSKFFAALEGKKSSAATQNANPNANLSPMPTNVKLDDKGRADVAKQGPATAPAATAAPGGIGIKPNTGIVPNIGGIKGPTAPVEETQAQLDKGAAERVSAFGINEGNQKAMSSLMAERANAKDEARRITSLRMAEFFGAWGATPGNTIVAGLNALKNKMPDFISDIKEETKIRRQIDKDIAELDKLDRDEKNGIKKDYFKERSDLANRAMHRYGYELTAYSSAQQTAAYRDVGMTKAAATGAGGANSVEKNIQAAESELDKVRTERDKPGSTYQMNKMYVTTRKSDYEVGKLDAKQKTTFEEKLKAVKDIDNRETEIKNRIARLNQKVAPSNSATPANANVDLNQFWSQQ